MEELEKKNAKQIAALLKEAKVIPSKELEANQTVYRQLAELAPGNQAYKEKLAVYEEKIAARARYKDEPEQALSLGKVSWTKDGFGSVMMINNATISNDAPFAIKDFTLECEHFAESGSKIDSNTRTIFQVVPANGAKTIREFNMGFIASQAESTSCEITNAKVA